MGEGGLEAELERRVAEGRAATPRLVGASELGSEQGSTLERTAPDWTGLPLRVTACLGRARALAALDRPSDGRGASGRDFQEEYVEWRLVRDERGIRRVELTTELADRWKVLAAHDPATVVELVAELAREPAVTATEVFGDYDPSGPRATPDGRERAFAATMLGPEPRSALNDGRRAICCMTQRTNSLGALISLAAAALQPRSVTLSGGLGRRSPNMHELQPLLGRVAQPGRASDPIIVERLARLAFEGRPVALERPLALCLLGVQSERLRTPSGEVVPPEWFAFERPGAPRDSSSGRGRPQRLTLEVPAGEGFRVSDLVDAATEAPIRFGGQIAELVQVALPLVVGPEAPGRPAVVEAVTPVISRDRMTALGCEEISHEAGRLEARP